MDFQLKVFKSLNCLKCQMPFSNDVKDRNGPQKFSIFGLAICTQCHEDIIVMESQELEHQSHGDFHDDEAWCFDETKPAYFLVDLLNSPAIAMSPDGNGYYLIKPFDIPECVICQEEYSIEIEDRKPRDLTCNHTICSGCVKKTGSLKDMKLLMKSHGTVLETSLFFTICPVCAVDSPVFPPSYKFDDELSRTNLLIEFLEELPEMTKQLEAINGQKEKRQLESRKEELAEITDHFDCQECVREFPIEDMFSCLDCSKKICGSCVTRRHREHKLTDLFIEETRRISEETKQIVSIQIDGYKRIFPELHQQLIERIAAFEEVLSDKVEGIAKLESLEKTKDEFDKCKNYGERFEQISENYLPNLRSFDTDLKNLIDELKEAKISETEKKPEKK